jgi:hypothetical protein
MRRPLETLRSLQASNTAPGEKTGPKNFVEEARHATQWPRKIVGAGVGDRQFFPSVAFSVC